MWGDDSLTIDGTGVRDYIHVCDLADGHVATLDYLNRMHGLLTLNLGTRAGHLVLKIVKLLKKFMPVPSPTKMGLVKLRILPSAG